MADISPVSKDKMKRLLTLGMGLDIENMFKQDTEKGNNHVEALHECVIYPEDGLDEYEIAYRLSLAEVLQDMGY